ncbi:MAG: serine protease [Cyanobacteria bacterium SBLK]|nr:serine protease [Cyanobacteria bacterium SBLK]
MTEKTELLQSCTVKLSLVQESSNDYVTGFFISSTLILTCAHGIAENAGIGGQVWGNWQGQIFSARVEKMLEDCDRFDFALLQLVLPLDNSAFLELDSSLKVGDILYNFGYPDAHKIGEPSTFKYEGLDGDDPPLLKFTGDRVLSGLSGSPLLNQRTGKVCGIVVLNRDYKLDFGGWGVPISTIFTVFPELQPQPITFPAHPFVSHRAIDDPAYLFGRERELTFIFDTLNVGSGVALIGETGMGKTAILKAIASQTESRLQESRQPVYANLSNIFNEEEFYLTLCDRIGIEFCRGGYWFARRLRDRRILLLLDNIDNMKWEGLDRQVRAQFRDLANQGKSSPLRLVVATRTPLERLFDDSGVDSPFVNICSERILKPWDDAIARDFIEGCLRGHSRQFSEKEIYQIILDSKGIPANVIDEGRKLCDRYRYDGE